MKKIEIDTFSSFVLLIIGAIVILPGGIEWACEIILLLKGGFGCDKGDPIELCKFSALALTVFFKGTWWVWFLLSLMSIPTVFTISRYIGALQRKKEEERFTTCPTCDYSPLSWDAKACPSCGSPKLATKPAELQFYNWINIIFILICCKMAFFPEDLTPYTNRLSELIESSELNVNPRERLRMRAKLNILFPDQSNSSEKKLSKNNEPKLIAFNIEDLNNFKSSIEENYRGKGFSIIDMDDISIQSSKSMRGQVSISEDSTGNETIVQCKAFDKKTEGNFNWRCN